MIHIDYIHEYDDEIRLLQEQRETQREIKAELEKMDYYIESIAMYEFFESSDEIVPMMEGVSDALTTIGDRIIAIVKRMKKFITDAIDKMKDMFLGADHNMKEVEKLVKKDPDKAALKVRNLIAEGKLTVNDFSDLAKYYQQIDQVLKEMDKTNSDPGKLQKMIKKAEEGYKSHETAFKAVGAISATALSITKLINTFKSNNKSIDSEIEKAQSMAAKHGADLQMRMDALNDPSAQKDLNHCRTRASVLAHIAASEERVIQGHVNGWTKVKLKLFDMTDFALRKCRSDGVSLGDVKKITEEQRLSQSKKIDTYGKYIRNIKSLNTPLTQGNGGGNP